jgi:hypothetical protein
MQKFRVLAGSTSIRLQIFLRDNSVAYDKGKTGLAHNTASLSAYYFRDGDTATTAITLVTATLGTWTSGGFIVVDGTNMPGMYELSIPNAAIATGAKWVTIQLKGAAGMAEEVIFIELLGNNEYAAAWSSGFNDGISAAVGAAIVETGITRDEILRLIGAAVAGNYDSGTGTFRAVDNSGTTRIATTLAGADRTNVVTP